ncbi:hypothetical protein TRFO_22681 [Tritrichomonas foetus]|uniref:LIM zinc-binding domain-containing protein n=1 Tax=Tritrichomonas foetus TaxID=1144522 RepID=A0A1J4KCR4_9EUKA|nr:hypothetical protein TRFO_22681 [Tritrichomonas foetus]|eukprot:OHT08762.1 hypothetical protein TRFO_22681 [Tritrichomonas foetus]
MHSENNIQGALTSDCFLNSQHLPVAPTDFPELPDFLPSFFETGPLSPAVLPPSNRVVIQNPIRPSVNFSQSTVLPIIQGSSSLINMASLNNTFSNDELESLPSIESTEILPTLFNEMYKDKHEIISKLCQICGGEITGKALFANGYHYHLQCATCQFCNQKIETPSCYMYKTSLLCKTCLQNGKICSACNQPAFHFHKIEKQFYHTDCISCYNCGDIIAAGSEKVVNSKIICKRCFNYAMICKVCNQKIFGDYIIKFGKAIHKDCFQCYICHCKLKGNDFVAHHNHSYCQNHGRIYRESCAFCKASFNFNDPIVTFNHRKYHKNCLVCRLCGCDLSSDCHSIHHRPYCTVCYQQITSLDPHIKEQTHHNPQTTNSRRMQIKDTIGILVVMPMYSHDEIPFVKCEPTQELTKELFTPDLTNDSIFN